MKRWLGIGLWLVLASAQAETLYVGERILLGLYEEPNSQGERLTLLQSADQVEVLERQDGFARVQTPNGTIGWVSARYLTDDMPNALRVAELETENAQLRASLDTVRDELRIAREQIERLQTQRAAAPVAAVEQPRIESEAASGDGPLPWTVWLGLAVVGVLAGFGIGAWWIDRRVRNRFAGLRPY